MRIVPDRRFGSLLELARRRLPSSSADLTKANLSTSNSPWSVILRCGMTGSARNATCRNGSGNVQPSALAASRRVIELVGDRLERLGTHQPGDRQRQFGGDLAVLGDGEAAAAFRSAG